MISRESTVTAVQKQVSTELGSGVAILHLDSGIYYSLNEVGTRIWQLIQEARPVSAICAVILEEYEVEPEQCEYYVIQLLEELHDEKLIQVSNGSHK